VYTFGRLEPSSKFTSSLLIVEVSGSSILDKFTPMAEDVASVRELAEIGGAMLTHSSKRRLLARLDPLPTWLQNVPWTGDPRMSWLLAVSSVGGSSKLGELGEN
jgi:hypothetical protein